MSKIKHSETSANKTIRESIQLIARHGLFNNDNVLTGTERIVGYVAKIHEEGDLLGTVDVQEYIPQGEDPDIKIGYHEGVRLSALQDNSKGLVIVPKMYSDVIVSKDPESGVEYVSMFSHVDVIQLDAHENISVGVKEREPFNENDENAPDVEDLPETGIFTNTAYTKDSVTTSAQNEKAKTKAIQTVTPTEVSQVIGDNQTSTKLTDKEIELKHGKSVATFNDTESTVAQGSSMVKVTDGVVFVGNDQNTDDAVLGVALADVLSELISTLAKVTTNTQLGPQPFLNMAQFISMKSKIDAYKGSHTGFLTQKVQIQK